MNSPSLQPSTCRLEAGATRGRRAISRLAQPVVCALALTLATFGSAGLRHRPVIGHRHGQGRAQPGRCLERWRGGCLCSDRIEGAGPLPRTLQPQNQGQLLDERDLRYGFRQSRADRHRAQGGREQVPRHFPQSRLRHIRHDLRGRERQQPERAADQQQRLGAVPALALRQVRQALSTVGRRRLRYRAVTQNAGS